jgi:hypothetical protein
MAAGEGGRKQPKKKRWISVVLVWEQGLKLQCHSRLHLGAMIAGGTEDNGFGFGFRP